MIFKTEADFEAAMIVALQNKDWENNVIKYPTEEVLLKNWADIMLKINFFKKLEGNVKVIRYHLEDILSGDKKVKVTILYLEKLQYISCLFYQAAKKTPS